MNEDSLMNETEETVTPRNSRTKQQYQACKAQKPVLKPNAKKRKQSEEGPNQMEKEEFALLKTMADSIYLVNTLQIK